MLTTPFTEWSALLILSFGHYYDSFLSMNYCKIYDLEKFSLNKINTCLHKVEEEEED